MAYNRGLDLVEIQPTSRPPVVKIMDYGKYKYEQTKKARDAKKKQHAQEVKEMRFSAKISDHDYGYKMKHIREFLLNRDKVKASMRFRGREITHVELGKEIMEKLKKDTDDIARVEQEPKLEGNTMTLMLAPDPKKIKDYERLNAKKEAAEKAAEQEG
jgi:translation initiation factor IF-3